MYKIRILSNFALSVSLSDCLSLVTAVTFVEIMILVLGVVFLLFKLHFMFFKMKLEFNFFFP
jgi:hypothetical protein